MNKLMKKKKKGFTLIELIAVIAILAVLAVVAVPRVITYVDKSKKVAVQTEASTIYNAAEAAYNDGKLQVSKTEKQGQGPVQVASKSPEKVAAKSNDFDNLQISEVVETLKNENLLNNAEDSNINKLGAAKKLKDLKTIMNADVNSLDIDSQGVLQKVPVTESTTVQQQDKTK